MSNPIKVGDKVIKNPATWEAGAFDAWGAGIGIGVVVEPPFMLDSDMVDVRWSNGRAFQKIRELMRAPRDS